jgi:uncharacterized protein YcnI
VQTFTKKLSIITIFTSICLLFFSATVSAHVVVSPKEVLTTQRTTFAVSVPNESDTSAVVGVRLVIPEGLDSVTPFAKAGWTIEMVKNGEGEEAIVSEIIWTSAGGSVPVSLKDEFQFGAKAPKDKSELQWKAYETYADGTVSAWDQEPSEAEDNKPYSVTRVVSETAQEVAVAEANQAASDAQAQADLAFYIAIAGVILGLVAVFLATRKK